MELPKADNETKACPCMHFWHLLTVCQRQLVSVGGLPCDVSVLGATSAQALTSTQVLMAIASGHTSVTLQYCSTACRKGLSALECASSSLASAGDGLYPCASCCTLLPAAGTNL